MKKISFLLLIMMLCFSAVACAKESETVTDSVEEASVEAVSAQEPLEEKDIQAESKAGEASSKESPEGNVAAAEGTSESASASGPLVETKDKASSESSESAAAGDFALKENNSPSEASSTEEAKDASSETAETVKEESTPEPAGYGRILFVGDSRSVDMFSESANVIMGDVYNDITVYCKDGAQFDDMVGFINAHGIDNFDTLVTWMGCNDFGNFSQYGPYYDELLAQGKQVVACTVGPTQDEYLLDDMDWYYYPNQNQINYNNSLLSWANSKGVKIIDLYSYISGSSTISLVPADGIHYLPQPTTELWNVITGSLK